ncbi:MAG: 3-phosphoshikimate 1-carboxyvinyltransferase [Acidobacteriota bacterium]|nr:3-phosphoshikimate 1-carboxyvinyltransferase [Acidobacteriota bacterium]
MKRAPFEKVDEMMTVNPAASVSGRVRVPGSKSLTNRYLLLAALARGTSNLTGPLESDDTVYMRRALAQVGVTVDERPDAWTVQGREDWHPPAEEIFVGNAGTVMRFFTPSLAVSDLNAVITGNERMLVRPIKDLVDGLIQLGAEVTYLGEEGYPPLRVRGPMKPGKIAIRGDSSSQYLSGLLMTLPLLDQDSEITIEGPLVSRTYVEMTINCIRQNGAVINADFDKGVFTIPGNQHYTAGIIPIEPDASTASYWFALPLMVGGSIEVENVPKTSDQGDFGLIDIFEQMGAAVERMDDAVRITSAELKGVEVDMNTMSDVAPTLAVVATLASSPTTIRNIYNMRIKECDRIECIQTAFDALGLKMENGRDWMKIYPGKPTRAAQVNPEDDHRMAMIFALLGLAHGGVTIQDPECVAKTYPTFYEEFSKVLSAR